MSLSYRADIDGLRAVAVLLVVLFHFGVPIFPGGYIGVDVFFVISGYLITKIVDKKVTSATFTFADFYKRRFKRILPVFYVVCFSTALSGYFILLPEDYQNFFDSFTYASLFLANFYFWEQSQGYFGLSAHQTPLLHLWSLSVEEQFYVFWPFVLIILHKYITVKKILLMSLILLSFMFAQWAADNNKVYAYYFLLSRAGELVLGGVLVYLKPNACNKISNNIVAFIGLILILFPAFYLSKSSVFPGVNAFYPCLGAALLIFTGSKESLISKLLSFKPLVGIGLISYSLYLWHWPPLAFIEYMHIDFDNTLKVIVFCILLIASYLSWRFVEIPLRNNDLSFKFTVILYFLLPLTLVVSMSVMLGKHEGYLERFSSDKQEKINYIVDKFPPKKNCLYLVKGRYCDYGVLPENADILLVGDSHGNALIGFIESLAFDSNLSLHASTNPGQPILLGIESVRHENNNIRRNLDGVNRHFLSLLSHPYKYVVMAGRYSQYVLGEYEHDNKPLFLYNKNKLVGPSVQNNLELLKNSLDENIKSILSNSSIPVFILGVPEFKKDMSRCTLYRDDADCGIQRSLVDIRQKPVEDVFKELKEKYPMIILIDPKTVMCDEEQCQSSSLNHPYYFDSNHLNYKSSRFLGELFIKTSVIRSNLSKA